MFTGIIEELAVVQQIEQEGTNVHFTFQSSVASELKIDQSVAHNGVCLTVVKINGLEYMVTAVAETLERTNLSSLQIGDGVNLERCTKVGDRLDGHIVQGHVDTVGKVLSIKKIDKSFLFDFDLPKKERKHLIEKASICVNGISLTISKVTKKGFQIWIIPHTYKETNLSTLKKSSLVNIEIDILSKYVRNYFNEKK